VIVLCAHDIVQSPAELPWEVTERDFEMVIKAYLEQGHTLATLDDLPHAPDRSIALTVDDGAAGAADWLLRRAVAFGIRAMFFVVVDWLDNPPVRSAEHAYRGLASWEQVAELRDAGHAIGSHSMTHVRLPTMPDDTIRYELSASRQRIEAMLQIEVRHFAAPYGRLSPGVIDAAKEAGYLTVSSTIPGINGPTERRSGVLRRLLLRSDPTGLALPSAAEVPR
jgi:peptidoglycan/xylan/chitin deacetylase (PgdA/CDA1 family)